MPRDSYLAMDLAICPNCLYAFQPDDDQQRVPGHVRDLVRSKSYLSIFADHDEAKMPARGWVGYVKIQASRNVTPRDVGSLCLRGSWVGRELGDLTTEQQLLDEADGYLDDALRRGLSKGDPAMVMYLLGEINRRRGGFLRGREALTFLGNNPRFRYPALLLTVLIEEEDSTPYWSLHSPEEMEKYSSRFKGLFPALRSIPPGKVDFYAEELADQSDQPDEDDRRKF
jgi:hypothetical protein